MRHYFALVLVVVYATSSVGQDKQQQANSLISRIATLSDVRAAGSPPFSLKAKVQITASDGRTIEGIYDETWISRDQWRVEITVENEHRIEIVNQDKDYVVNVPATPVVSARIQGLMNLGRLSRVTVKVSKLKDGEIMGLKATCVIGQSETFCFDKDNGQLLSQSFITASEAVPKEWICRYGEYREFGNKSFPRAISCTENEHLKLQIRIVEVSQQDHADIKMFQPPDGATESRFYLCNIKTPPHVLSGPDSIASTHGFGSGNMAATLSITIDEGGHVLNPRVVNSGGPQVDHWAMNNVLGWRYQPGTCDGVPISTTINVQFGIHHGH
jgi:TonB family protein